MACDHARGYCAALFIIGTESQRCRNLVDMNTNRAPTVLKLVLAEAERSIHDALCVVRSLVKQRFLISGGGSAETEIAYQLGKWAKEEVRASMR